MKKTNIAALALVGILSSITGFTILPAVAAPPEMVPYPPDMDASKNATQQEVYDVVHKYETALNAGDTNTILNLFSDHGVAEWNNKRTYATRQQKMDGYNDLFKIAKFSTVFEYDAVNVYGDAAVVRTHHHVGAAVIENGQKVIDLNREVFVLHKIRGEWKIVLYTFNTDPVQGEG